jgi:hypothetical protein
VLITGVIDVNLDTGGIFVNMNAVKVVHQAVIKAMEIVVAALPVFGEQIVTTNAYTTVSLQAVLDQTDNAVLASLDIGVYCVMKHVAMVVRS